jgi:hypothetical protein
MLFWLISRPEVATRRIGRLAGAVNDPVVLIDADGFRGGGHVGAFGDADAAVFNQGLRMAGVDLVLGGAGQGDVHMNSLILDDIPDTFPDVAAG